MAIACRLDAISQGQKKSRFPGPNPPPTFPRNGCCRHQKHYVMDAARIKSITHRVVYIIGGFMYKSPRVVSGSIPPLDSARPPLILRLRPLRLGSHWFSPPILLLFSDSAPSAFTPPTRPPLIPPFRLRLLPSPLRWGRGGLQNLLEINSKLLRAERNTPFHKHYITAP
jgi:hypothetical protein